MITPLAPLARQAGKVIETPPRFMGCPPRSEVAVGNSCTCKAILVGNTAGSAVIGTAGVSSGAAAVSVALKLKVTETGRLHEANPRVIKTRIGIRIFFIERSL